MNHQQYTNIVTFLNKGKIPEQYDMTAKKRSFQNYCKPFQLEEGKLFRVTKWQSLVLILKEEETEAISLEKNKVFDKIKKELFETLKNMSRHVIYVK